MMNNYRIAIFRTEDEVKEHSTSWVKPWIEYCQTNRLDYSIINPYDSGIIEQLKSYNCLLWHFSNYSYRDMLFARSILYSAKEMGLDIFPDYQTSWHFDDKVAETYLLQSVNAPIPNSYIYYDYDKYCDFIKNIQFPIVAKLRCGAGSHNVKLLKSENDARKYGKAMLLGKGFDSSPNLIYKASSNIKSSKTLSTFIKRAKRIPEFLRTFRSAKKFGREKGYVFLQEFIENNGFDLKIVVVGDKLSFVSRDIRKNDFRASGGGSLNYDKERVPQNVIASAFQISDKLNFSCMGYDYVIDSKTGKGLIIEISYGFAHFAQLDAKGYFDRDGNWHEEPLNAPQELLRKMTE